MSVMVSVQRAVDGQDAVVIPGDHQIEGWVNSAVTQAGYPDTERSQITVRIVTETEITELNKTYRGKDIATNVLSFPFEAPPGLPPGEMEEELGDVVVCAAVVEQEAQTQHKNSEAHWAHMIIHGSLHLLGYDHLTEDEAQEMESLEKIALDNLGYADPYCD